MQAIAFVVPELRMIWENSDTSFGLVFGAGLLGTMAGAPLLGGLSDRIGRKAMIIISTAVFGCLTLASAFAPSIWVLILLRFVTGLGLGGAMPNVIALSSEYAPARMRSTVVTATFSGYSVGAIVGGIVSARLLDLFDWRSVFILGGTLPLLLLPALLLWLPESARYLALRTGEEAKILRIVQRIAPGTGILPASPGGVLPGAGQKTSPRQLFMKGRAYWTVLIWIALFTGLLTAYFLVNWIPSVLMDAGLSRQSAVMGTVVLNAGGIIGSLLIGRMSDKTGPFLPIGGALVLGSLVVAAIGFSSHSSALALAMVALAGLSVFGSQLAMPAVLARYYPTFIRGTGIGWGMGLGRLGAVVGVVTGGALMSIGLSIQALFLLAAIPVLVTSFAIWRMSKHIPLDLAPAISGPAPGQ